MKKMLSKPQNWQDFESLCKKLWGEIWKIPNKIKKNGRLGQIQSGVDVYGIPYGEDGYWGIQCKGKDDYTKAKLSEKEILAEISNAHKFEPKLKVFIFATTYNKDANIEKFVRNIDKESQDKGSFEILLFCWGDIADLIEDNFDTYNWYLHGIGHIGKYDLTVWLDGFKKELILKPIYIKQTSVFKQTEKAKPILTEKDIESMIETYNNLKNYIPKIDLGLNRVNRSFVTFEIILDNTGAMVIKDWKLSIKFIQGVRRIGNGHPLFPKLSETTWVDNKLKSILYNPRNNSPLIQKDNKFFKISILLEHGATEVVAEWEILARNFNKTKTISIKIEPEYIERTITKESDSTIKSKIEIIDYITE